jgi:hypothetical protein
LVLAYVILQLFLSFVRRLTDAAQETPIRGAYFNCAEDACAQPNIWSGAIPEASDAADDATGHAAMCRSRWMIRGK